MKFLQQAACVGWAHQKIRAITCLKGSGWVPNGVYPERNLIVSGEAEEHFESKVMELLLYHAENQDEVLKRDQIINHIRGTIVTDEVLSRVVSLLCNCPQDSTRTPEFIRTIPKAGYRLICQVEPLQAK